MLEQLEAATDVSFNDAVAALDNAIGAMDGKAELAGTPGPRVTAGTRTAQSPPVESGANQGNFGDHRRQEDEEVHSPRGAPPNGSELKIREFHGTIGAGTKPQRATLRDLEDVNRRIDQCRQKADKADLARRRAGRHGVYCHVAPVACWKRRTEELRTILNKEIQTNFGLIVFKDYVAEIAGTSI